MIAARKATQKNVFICSPFRPRGSTDQERVNDLRKNRELAKLACRYAVKQGYMPMAPHLFFPEFLSENDPAEREAGIRYGLEWLAECDELWVIGTRITAGMIREIVKAVALGIPIVQRIFVVSGISGEKREKRNPGSRRRCMGGHPDPGYDDYDGYYKFENDDEEGILYDGD